jgi:hypothetical protein
MREEMTPTAFCREWITNPLPGEYGYKNNCTKLISEVTGLTQKSIERYWNKDTAAFNDENFTVQTRKLLNKENLLRKIIMKAATIPEVIDQITSYQA